MFFGGSALVLELVGRASTMNATFDQPCFGNPVNPDALICPLCEGALTLVDRQLICPNHHSCDLARQGCVQLLPVQQKRSQQPGDSKEMVVARSKFLNSGIYHPIGQKLTELGRSLWVENRALRLLDAGCGEGYYLDYLARELSPQDGLDAVGMDISKEAVAAAAKRNREISWVVGSNARPPLTPEIGRAHV